MTPRQANFVVEFAKDLNATAAAKRAGYSPKNARSQAARMLTNAGIATAVNEVLASSLAKAKLEVERVDREIAAIAFADIRDYFDTQGRLRPIKDWPPGAAAAVASIETCERKVGGRMAAVVKLKLADKVSALTLGARRLGMLRDRVKPSGTLSLQDLVLASLQPREGSGEPK